MRTSATLLSLVLFFIAVTNVLSAIPNQPKGPIPNRPKGVIPHRPRLAIPNRPRPAIPNLPRPAIPNRPRPAIPHRPRGAIPRPKGAIPNRPLGAIPNRPLGAIPNQPKGATPNQLIDESCKSASSFDRRFNPQYCVSMVNSAPFNKGAPMSPQQLAEITMGLLDKHVSDTRAKIMALNGPGQKNPALKGAFERCLSSYNNAFHRSTDGVQKFTKQDFKTADAKVSMIQGDGSDCEHQFQIHKVASPITKENLDTQYLSSMSCLFIRSFTKTYTAAGLHPH